MVVDRVRVVAGANQVPVAPVYAAAVIEVDAPDRRLVYESLERTRRDRCPQTSLPQLSLYCQTVAARPLLLY